ncbi:hypothetical protein LR48_Vigan01g083900 [Vigna angularis]|uniref:WAT1-related protein n=1 Tax=Phaseolus angularis TaxID=3914 RepID=A0A0L9TM94_PHAAN|nr:hypothetical protein LR48_Vigan01g083900 [Vigna angularis]
MNHIVKVMQELKPPFLMMLVQVAYTGNTVIASLAITDGMSIRVFSAYRHIFGAVITFILAFIFESYEKLNLRTVTGKTKVMGTIIGVNGTMMLSFFKGVEINIWKNIHINLMHKKDNDQKGASDGKQWIGVLSGIGCCFSFSVWLIIQGFVTKSTLHEGIAVTTFVNIVTSWCVRKKGPLYASVFNPLTLVLVATTAPLLLQEKLYLGSVLGAALIVCGLYMVLWSKSKEMKQQTDLVSSETELSSTTEVVVVSTTNKNELAITVIVLGASLIVCGLYMVLWSKSKEIKPQTDLVLSETELSTTEVVVVSANDKSDHVSNNQVNSNSNTVNKGS